MTELTIWEDKTQLQEIKNICAKDLSETEFKLFIQIGKSLNLNPFTREIWGYKYGGQATIFVGRDGYRKNAQAHPDYDYHLADAVYTNDLFEVVDGQPSHKYSLKNRGQLVGAYAVIKRKSASKPIFVFADLKEYSTGKALWASKPATMIKKVAEAHALRMAFQSLFAGTYDESEQWEQSLKDVTPKSSKTAPQVLPKIVTLSYLEEKITAAENLEQLQEVFRALTYETKQYAPELLEKLIELKDDRKNVIMDITRDITEIFNEEPTL